MQTGADPLVIRSLEFLGGLAPGATWRPPTDLPEVAFAGRSNVGKSSLLNRLVRRKAFARVSNTPGRTQEINFFKVNDRFLLVDLPGYGYAVVSKSKRALWGPLIESYLSQTPQLRGLVHLLDARRDPTEEDRRMIEFIASIGVPTLFALTKIDKLKAAEREARVAEIGQAIGVDSDQLIPFSAVTGEGRDELAESVAALVEGPSWRDA